MTTLTKKCHIQTLADAIELSLLASTIALIADSAWVVHDIIHNGWSLTYACILAGLVCATCITGYALVRHHTGRMVIALQTLLHDKLAKQKSINKHKREHK